MRSSTVPLLLVLALACDGPDATPLPTAEAVWLPAGSAIACRCAVDVAGECAHYAIEVEAAVPGEPLRSVASFAWSGDG